MQNENMTNDPSLEVFSIPCGDLGRMELVKHSDFVALEKKLKMIEASTKDAFFAGFKLSKYFPSDTDISPKYDEYINSLEDK